MHKKSQKRIFYIAALVNSFASSFKRYVAEKFLQVVCSTGTFGTKSGRCPCTCLSMLRWAQYNIHTFWKELFIFVWRLLMLGPRRTWLYLSSSFEGGVHVDTFCEQSRSSPFRFGLARPQVMNDLNVQYVLKSMRDCWHLLLYQKIGYELFHWPHTAFKNCFTIIELNKIHQNFMHFSSCKLNQLLHRVYAKKLHVGAMHMRSKNIPLMPNMSKCFFPGHVFLCLFFQGCNIFSSYHYESDVLRRHPGTTHCRHENKFFSLPVLFMLRILARSG